MNIFKPLISITCAWMIFAFMAFIPPSHANDNKEMPASAPRFFAHLSDIPLMADMEEITEQSVIFDKAEGRIIQSSAFTQNDSVKAIRSFYEATLPQLGWQKISPDSFVRNEELLHFTINTEGAYRIIHFTVSPR